RNLPPGPVARAAQEPAPLAGPARAHGAELVSARRAPGPRGLARGGPRHLRGAPPPARATDLAAHDRGGVRVQRPLLPEPAGGAAVRRPARRDPPGPRLGGVAGPLARARRGGRGLSGRPSRTQRVRAP